ncbi:MAG TPA: SpoIIE family protein phosphatase [Anaerolineae bacterium]|nr:SpoIIE family protein phosphatase [Anaerolineae bacterium]
MIEWGVASRPHLGQSVSGDLHLVKQFEGGTLLAAVDGLGYGFEAAAAARIAVDTLKQGAGEAVDELVKRCHARLKGTRGVALSLASISEADETVTWTGVGNVEGRLLRADPHASPLRETLLLRGGVVGYQLPKLHPSTIPIARGDVLILVTDGIRSGFDKDLVLSDPPQRIADHILAAYGKESDDDLVLVARFAG